LDADGNRIWTRLFGSSGDDQATGVSVNQAVYVCGLTNDMMYGQANNGSNDMFASKFDMNGNMMWTRLFGSPGDDHANAIATSVNSTSVYVVGFASGSINGQPYNGAGDVAVIKVDSDGNILWVSLFGTSTDDYGQGVAVTSDELALFVVGYTRGSMDGQPSNGNTDLFITKLNSNGVHLWTHQWGSVLRDQAFAVSISGNNQNLYATGYTFGAIDGQPSTGLSLYLSKNTICPQGYYCTHDLTPIPCGTGSFSSTRDATDISTCISCPYGYFCSGTNNTQPTPCPLALIRMLKMLLISPHVTLVLLDTIVLVQTTLNQLHVPLALIRLLKMLLIFPHVTLVLLDTIALVLITRNQLLVHLDLIHLLRMPLCASHVLHHMSVIPPISPLFQLLLPFLLPMEPYILHSNPTHSNIIWMQTWHI